MAFQLVHAVIHYFEKEKGITEVDPQKIVKKSPFDPKIKTLISLAEGINSLLGKPGNNVVWGQFEINNRQGNFPAATQRFAEALTREEFSALTLTALDELIAQAKIETFATGGHTLFAHYISEAIPFILIANIKQRNGLTLDSNYIPIESVDIDMSKVHQACRINLARYSESVLQNAVPDEEELDKTYLCFISKGRDSEASAYFIKALGCTPGIASTRATNNAIDAIEDFFRNDPELAPFSLQARDNVVAYLSTKLESKQKATLSGLQHAAESAIPVEKAELIANLGQLNEHLNGETNKRIPEEFSVSKTILDRKTKIKGKSNRWVLQFDKSALSSSVNGIVSYNKVDGKITLSDLPDSMKRTIEDELNSREGRK